MPGKGTRQSTSFLRLSRRRTWTTSCRSALSNSRSLNTNSAALDNQRRGANIPAAVSGAADAGARSTEIDLPGFAGLQPMAYPSLDQRAIVLEVRTNAVVDFHTPASIRTMPQNPSPSETTLVDSFTARGSSSRKEGTVRKRVTAVATTKGTMRRPKTRSAQSLAERCWPYRHTRLHTRQTASERVPYRMKKIEKQTAMPRTANIYSFSFGSASDCASSRRLRS